RNARAMMSIRDVKLVEHQPERIGRNLGFQRTELGEADGFSVNFGDAECVSLIAELRLPIGNRKARQESVEILPPIEVRKGFAKNAVEETVERTCVFDPGTAID